MKIFATTLLLQFAFIFVFSQPWVRNAYQKTNSEHPNFYEIQEEFYKYWKGKVNFENRAIEKGKGWKQFKRWEYFMEPRVNKKGRIPKDIIWYESQKRNNKSTANWSLLGPHDTPTDINSGGRRGSGRINCVEFHPTDPNTFWTGSPSGGFWKTTDGGSTWATTTDDLAALGVSDIAVNPNTPTELFIATGDGDHSDTYSIGILKSTDGGNNWTHIGPVYNPTDYLTCRRLLINPNNTNILIVTTNNGVMRTIDGGANWTTVQSGNMKDLEFKPGDPTVVYATHYGYGGGAAVYKSTDSGANFTDISGSIPVSGINRIELAVTPDNPAVVYALCSEGSGSGFEGLYKSTNSGTTWSQVTSSSSINLLGWATDGNDSGGQGWYDLSLAVSPTDENVILVGGVNIWKSTDSGSSWNLNAHWYGGGGATYVHADHHNFDYNYLNNKLYSGNDGGLYESPDDGTTWLDISDGLEILQIYRLGTSSTNSDVLLTGCQDNGTMKMDASTWYAVIGGDGMECLVDYTNENIMYGEYYYGAIQKSTDGGYNWGSIEPSGAGNGAWVTPFVIDPTDNNTLYIGYTDVYKTTNAGNSWNAISSSLTGGKTIRSLAVAPSNTDYIYAGTSDSLYKTTNGGTSWIGIEAGLPNYYVTYIAVSPNDPDWIWVTLSNYEAGEKVYASTDGGSNWTNYSSGLPNLPANCIEYEVGTNNALYVGTDVGIYYRNASMSSWISYNTGLPNVIVNELEIHYGISKIRAATYGRGVWESDLYQNPAMPSADYSYNISDCSGEVSFTDLSGGVPTAWSWSFGDGNSSTDQNPDHIYSSLGSYTVELIVTNSYGSDTVTYTVDLTSQQVVSDFNAASTEFCSYPADVQFTNVSLQADSWLWDFGDGNNSTDENPLHSYNANGDYTVKLIAYSTLCGNDTLTMSNFISIDSSNLANEVMGTTGAAENNCCTGTIKDSGGDNDYQNNTTSYFVIKPNNAISVSLTFNMFDVEPGSGSYCDYDYIAIYDGDNLSAPLIGKYCNTTGNPGTINSTGNALTIKQYSDQYVTGQGFEAVWNCVLSGDEEKELLAGKINIYPNPSQGIFTVEGKNIYKIRVISVSGSLIYEFSGAVVNKKIIDLTPFSNGIYFIKVATDIGVKTEKIIVE